MTRPKLVHVLAAGGILVACGGGGSGGDTPTTPSPPGQSVVTVDLAEFSYEPKSVTIQPGQTVRWVMRGSDPTHTVTAIDGAFDSGFVFTAPGASFERTFGEADRNRTFNYSCASHTDCCDMKGSIRVGADAPDPRAGY